MCHFAETAYKTKNRRIRKPNNARRNIKAHEKKYNEIKIQKHSFGEKAKEIIIEILIIVFAVTLSIWLHSWSEERYQQKEA